jgi:aminoglycoside phosphotransferase (APT) family kinase protein
MGRVVRAGATVRREAGPWTETVQDLLRHVRARGVTWVPEPLGLDEQGREVVGFLEGDVPSYPLPEWVWSESVLADAGRRLRELHDATLDFPREDRTWRLAAHEPVEVICHNDFAPYNLVFRDGELVGAIDFDTASPGSRVWDLAYVAYRLVPLTAPGNPDGRPGTDRRGRLERLCTAYGGLTPAAVLAAVPLRLDDIAAFSAGRGLDRHAELYRADAAHLRAALAPCGEDLGGRRWPR